MASLLLNTLTTMQPCRIGERCQKGGSGGGGDGGGGGGGGDFLVPFYDYDLFYR